MTATLTVKVETRRMWMAQWATRVACWLIVRRMMIPAALPLVAWSIRRGQYRINGGQWRNLHPRKFDATSDL